MRKKNLLIYYIILVALLAPVISFWWTGNGSSLLSMADKLTAIGRLLGLLSAFAILIEILLVSRLPIIEKYFDLHDNNDLHRLNGFLVLFTFIGHIIFIIFGYALPFKTGFFNQFVALNKGSSAVLLATIGALLFIGVIAFSMRFIREIVPYQFWYLTHLVIYSAVILTFIHQITDGRDFIENPWFMIYWIVLSSIVILNLIIFRFARPISNYFKYKFYLSEIVEEGHGIYSIIVKGRSIDKFKYEPGQYGSFIFLSRKMWWEPHPYSFSSCPGDNFIRFTIKTSGDFGKKIALLKAGTRIIIDGPRGSFIASRAESKKVILIAGGIGIAPYIPIIKNLLSNGKKVKLLYAVHDVSQLAFKKELVKLEKNGLELYIFNSSKSKRINEEILASCAKEDADIFICGPTSMTKQFCTILNNCGLCKSKVIAERFSY